MAERGVEASHEAIRCWVIKFGPLIPANLRWRGDRPTGRWHLDEAVVKIGGRSMTRARFWAFWSRCVATSMRRLNFSAACCEIDRLSLSGSLRTAWRHTGRRFGS